MHSLCGSNFCNFGQIFFDGRENVDNIQTLFCNFAQNRLLMKICTNFSPAERKERPGGFWERLKICSKPPPKKPPRKPNPIETLLKRIHQEGVMAAREILSASTASLLSVAVTQPFDVLKVNYLAKSISMRGPWYRFFSSRFTHEIRLIMATKGFSRFYRGHLEAQRESLFQTISMFYTYQRVYQELENTKEIFKNYPYLCIFFAGFVSASISVLLLRPYATIQDQFINKRQLLQKFGPICAAYTLKQKLKLSMVFKGCFADFMYTGTQYGLRFLIYSKISDEILERRPAEETWNDYFKSDESRLSDFEPKKVVQTLSSAESLLAGAISGLISDLATHPMDVINTHLKSRPLQRQLYRYNDTCRKYGQCMRNIWGKQRIRGFYPGFLPMILKSAISTAVTFAVYDAMHEWLQVHFLDESENNVK